MKIYLLILSLLLIPTVFAVPQVVFSEVNLTITNGSFHLWGEGLDATDTYPITITGSGNDSSGYSCDFSYSRVQIPLTFSRDFFENDTDVAILINELATQRNYSSKWEECILERNEYYNNLSWCERQIGYESNYTTCKAELTVCQSGKVTQANAIKEKDEEIEDMTRWRNIFGVAAVICGVYAYNCNKKSKVSQVRFPSQVPGNQRV